MLMIPQKRHDECGLACLLMLLHQRNFYFSYRFLRKNGQYNSFYDMHIFLQSQNIDCQMFYADFLSLNRFPVVAVLRYPRRIHFIVVWKKEDSHIFYSDPASIRISKKKIAKIATYMGTEYFYVKELNPVAFKKAKKVYLPYKVKFLVIMSVFFCILYKLMRSFAII